MFKTFNEILGNYVRIPEKPKRIASLHPSITETLVEIGISDELVGVSSWCSFFVEGLGKTPVSSTTEVNYRRLEEINPDLILTTTGVQRHMAYELHSKGYLVFPIQLAGSLYGILANVLLTGALVDRAREAQELAERLAKGLEAARVKPKYDERPRIYVEIWPERYSITAGGLTFINDLIYAAGARNIFSEKPLTYFTPAFEDVTAANPDFILLVFETPRRIKEANLSLLVTERGWKRVKATEQGKIAMTLVKDLPLTLSGPSFVRSVRLLSEKLREFGVLAK